MVKPTTVLKLSKNLRIIAEGKKALIYNAFYGSGMVCHKDMLELIEEITPGESFSRLKEMYPQGNLEDSIQKLIEKGLVVENGHADANLPYRVYPVNIINSGGIVNKLRLNVIMACNMRCAYCYLDANLKKYNKTMMDWTTAKKALDTFFYLQKRHNHRHSIIRFFGGEPLLNWKLISQCLDYIKKVKNAISTDYILNTNGTVFSKTIAKKLADHEVGLAVSLDGIGKDHDRFRKFKSERGTYKVIVSNLKEFLESRCKVGIEATIGDHNILGLEKLVSLIAHLQDKYQVKVPLSLQHVNIVDKSNLDTSSIEEKVEQLLRFFDFAEIHGVRADTGLVHFPFNALKEQKNCGAYCRAIGGELCISPGGGIYPCGALPIRLGTIDNMEAVFRSKAYHQLVHRVAGNLSACRGCDIEAFCAGGCAANAFAANEVLHGSTQNCNLEIKIFRGLVKRFLLSTAIIG